jgi:hypothetical protein
MDTRSAKKPTPLYAAPFEWAAANNLGGFSRTIKTGKRRRITLEIEVIHSGSARHLGEAPMRVLMRDEFVSVLGPVDEAFIAEVEGTRARLEGLTAAWAWIGNE